WLVPWWRSFGQETLRTLAIRKAGVLVGLLPFYVYRGPSSAQRELLLLGVGTSDYLDGVFAPECSVRDVRDALDLMMDQNGWDALHATQLRPTSKLLHALEDSESAEHFATESCLRMPAVPISELPQKIRRNALYYRNRAARLGGVEFALAGADELDETFL